MQSPCNVLHSLSDDNPTDPDDVMSEQWLDHAIDLINRAVEQLEHLPSVCKLFLKILMSHSDPVECYSKVSEVLKDFPNLRDECKRFLTLEITPSYEILSEERRQMRTSSGMSKLGADVLNDDLVLKTNPTTISSSGRCENPRAMHCRNKLFDCEDEHYEMDMMINTARAAIARGERILSGGEGDGGEHLTGADLRCNEQVYGEAGIDVVNRLQESPGTVLPVVLGRLRQKEAEWSNAGRRWKRGGSGSLQKITSHHSATGSDPAEAGELKVESEDFVWISTTNDADSKFSIEERYRIHGFPEFCSFVYAHFSLAS